MQLSSTRNRYSCRRQLYMAYGDDTFKSMIFKRPNSHAAHSLCLAMNLLTCDDFWYKKLVPSSQPHILFPLSLFFTTPLFSLYIPLWLLIYAKYTLLVLACPSSSSLVARWIILVYTHSNATTPTVQTPYTYTRLQNSALKLLSKH